MREQFSLRPWTHPQSRERRLYVNGSTQHKLYLAQATGGGIRTVGPSSFRASTHAVLESMDVERRAFDQVIRSLNLVGTSFETAWVAASLHQAHTNFMKWAPTADLSSLVARLRQEGNSAKYRRCLPLMEDQTSSYWLCEAMATALVLDPVDAVNDVEILHRILEDNLSWLKRCDR